MPGSSPRGRHQESPLEPGEMPGMPQPHLASCNGNPEREKLRDCVHRPVGWNVGLDGEKPAVLIGPGPAAFSQSGLSMGGGGTRGQGQNIYSLRTPSNCVFSNTVTNKFIYIFIL